MANFGLFSEIAANCNITSVAEAGSFLKCEKEEEEEEAGVVFNHVLWLDYLSDGACVRVVISCFQSLSTCMCLNCAAPVTFPLSLQLHLKSFDFQLHLFTPQIMSPVPPSLPTNLMHPETIILPPVSFALHLQLHLLRHFEKSLPPRELHPPENEPTEESKEAHCFCIDRLGLCWVTIVKKK